MMSSTCASCSAVRVGISGPACRLGGMEVTPEGGVITEGASSSHPTPRARRRSPMTVMPKKAFMPAPLSRTEKLDAARACGGSSARTPPDVVSSHKRTARPVLDSGEARAAVPVSSQRLCYLDRRFLLQWPLDPEDESVARPNQRVLDCDPARLVDHVPIEVLVLHKAQTRQPVRLGAQALHELRFLATRRNAFAHPPVGLEQHVSRPVRRIKE